MRRIIIIGVTGSGKTTLGRNLSEQLGIPAIDLDEINWLPGWQERPLQESRQMVDAATQQPSWIICGNYSKFQDIFWERADTLIWLDYSMPRAFWQLLRRSIIRMVDKELICNGNIESWQNFLSRKSIMLWFFQSFRIRKQRGIRLFTNPQQNPHFTTMLRFCNPAETQRWLESCAVHDATASLLAA